MDIKCRLSGLHPKATVLVLSTQALKLHGGVAYEETKKPTYLYDRVQLLNDGKKLPEVNSKDNG